MASNNLYSKTSRFTGSSVSDGLNNMSGMNGVNRQRYGSISESGFDNHGTGRRFSLVNDNPIPTQMPNTGRRDSLGGSGLFGQTPNTGRRDSLGGSGLFGQTPSSGRKYTLTNDTPSFGKPMGARASFSAVNDQFGSGGSGRKFTIASMNDGFSRTNYATADITKPNTPVPESSAVILQRLSNMGYDVQRTIDIITGKVTSYHNGDIIPYEFYTSNCNQTMDVSTDPIGVKVAYCHNEELFILEVVVGTYAGTVSDPNFVANGLISKLSNKTRVVRTQNKHAQIAPTWFDINGVPYDAFKMYTIDNIERIDSIGTQTERLPLYALYDPQISYAMDTSDTHMNVYNSIVAKMSGAFDLLDRHMISFAPVHSFTSRFKNIFTAEQYSDWTLLCNLTMNRFYVERYALYNNYVELGVFMLHGSVETLIEMSRECDNLLSELYDSTMSKLMTLYHSGYVGNDHDAYLREADGIFDLLYNEHMINTPAILPLASDLSKREEVIAVCTQLLHIAKIRKSGVGLTQVQWIVGTNALVGHPNLYPVWVVIPGCYKKYHVTTEQAQIMYQLRHIMNNSFVVAPSTDQKPFNEWVHDLNKTHLESTLIAMVTMCNDILRCPSNDNVTIYGYNNPIFSPGMFLHASKDTNPVWQGIGEHMNAVFYTQQNELYNRVCYEFNQNNLNALCVENIFSSSDQVVMVQDPFPQSDDNNILDVTYGNIVESWKTMVDEHNRQRLRSRQPEILKNLTQDQICQILGCLYNREYPSYMMAQKIQQFANTHEIQVNNQGIMSTIWTYGMCHTTTKPTGMIMHPTFILPVFDYNNIARTLQSNHQLRTHSDTWLQYAKYYQRTHQSIWGETYNAEFTVRCTRSHPCDYETLHKIYQSCLPVFEQSSDINDVFPKSSSNYRNNYTLTDNQLYISDEMPGIAGYIGAKYYEWNTHNTSKSTGVLGNNNSVLGNGNVSYQPQTNPMQYQQQPQTPPMQQYPQQPNYNQPGYQQPHQQYPQQQVPPMQPQYPPQDPGYNQQYQQYPQQQVPPMQQGVPPMQPQYPQQQYPQQQYQHQPQYPQQQYPQQPMQQGVPPMQQQYQHQPQYPQQGVPPMQQQPYQQVPPMQPQYPQHQYPQQGVPPMQQPYQQVPPMQQPMQPQYPQQQYPAGYTQQAPPMQQPYQQQPQYPQQYPQQPPMQQQYPQVPPMQQPFNQNGFQQQQPNPNVFKQQKPCQDNKIRKNGGFNKPNSNQNQKQQTGGIKLGNFA